MPCCENFQESLFLSWAFCFLNQIKTSPKEGLFLPPPGAVITAKTSAEQAAKEKRLQYISLWLLRKNAAVLVFAEVFIFPRMKNAYFLFLKTPGSRQIHRALIRIHWWLEYNDMHFAYCATFNFMWYWRADFRPFSQWKMTISLYTSRLRKSKIYK